MRYACLIYSDENDSTANPDMGTPEQQEIFAGYMAFGEEAGAAGVLLGGEPLEPTSTATSVQVKDGDVVTTDGPFAETKEQLGGFYLIDAENLDEAIAWAAKIPHAQLGTIEVRPLMEYGDPASADAG